MPVDRNDHRAPTVKNLHADEKERAEAVRGGTPGDKTVKEQEMDSNIPEPAMEEGQGASPLGERGPNSVVRPVVILPAPGDGATLIQEEQISDWVAADGELNEARAFGQERPHFEDCVGGIHKEFMISHVSAGAVYPFSMRTYVIKQQSAL